MKLNIKTHRKQNNISLLIIGCGFMILMYLIFNFFDYNDKKKQRQNMSIEDLQNNSKIISSKEDYEFLNSTILSDSLVSDSILMTKISCFSIPHSKELRKYIKNIPDSIVPRAERIRMKNSLSKAPYLWDYKRLNNCWLIIPKDYNRMAQSDTTDYWEEFYKVFGENGKHNFSKPIFNSSKNILVIEHLISGGWLWAENEILLYKKENNIWKLVDKKSLWIS